MQKLTLAKLQRTGTTMVLKLIKFKDTKQQVNLVAAQKVVDLNGEDHRTWWTNKGPPGRAKALADNGNI